MTTLDDKKIAKNFFDEWVGTKGPKGWLGRYLCNTGRWYTNMLLEKGKIKADDVVLDVGCGSATIIINLLKKVSFKNPVYGLEPSDAQFEWAKKNITKADLTDKIVLKKGFASPLPFRNNYFDVLYASFIIKHLADKTLTDFLKEAYRVLKPEGRFLGWELEKVTSRLFRKLAKEPMRAMQYLRTFDAIKVFLEEAGFKNIVEFKVKNRGFWDFFENVGFKAIK